MREAIINLLRKWGCCHEWKLEQGFEIMKGQRTIGYKYLYVCKKCGKMKWVKAYL